jgi:hypothetical protein
VREYKSSDFAAIKRLHQKAGVGCDLNLLRFSERLVAEHEGNIVAAGIGRPSEQLDLVLDREFGDPQERWNVLVHLISCGADYLRAMGIRSMHCFVPREIERSYGKRLMSIGFEKEAGATFLKEI